MERKDISKLWKQKGGVAESSIVSDYSLDDRATAVRSSTEDLASVSRPALRPTQSAVQWVGLPGSFPLGYGAAGV
jgi:hypothetical protein